METPSLQATLKWLRIYHLFSFISGIVVSLLLALMTFVLMGDVSAFDSQSEYNFFVAIMFGTVAFILVCNFISLLAAVIVRKKTKVNWVFQLILVVGGFGSLLTIIPCIFLFLGLISEEGKNYYLR